MQQQNTCCFKHINNTEKLQKRTSIIMDRVLWKFLLPNAFSFLL